MGKTGQISSSMFIFPVTWMWNLWRILMTPICTKDIYSLKLNEHAIYIYISILHWYYIGQTCVLSTCINMHLL